MGIIREDISAAGDLNFIDPQSQLKKSAIDREKQKAVEKYNKEITIIDPSFKEKKFVNKKIVVRLRKDDYIVDGAKSSLLSHTEVKKTNRIILESDGGRNISIDTPLPYLPEGVIIAFDESLKELYPDLEVGAYVELDDFDLQSRLYYPNKLNFDYKVTSDEILKGVNPYKNYQGYVSISPSIIEAFVEIPEKCRAEK